jgi:hypothetical protein
MATSTGSIDSPRLASAGNVVAGLWLAVFPWIFDHGVQWAVFNEMIVGILVAIAAGARLANETYYLKLSRVNLALGIWLILAPFILAYGSRIEETDIGAPNIAPWNDIIVGIVVVLLAIVSANTTHAGTGRERKK